MSSICAIDIALKWLAYKRVTLGEQTRSYEYADMFHNKSIIVPSNNCHGTEPFYSLAPTFFVLLILCSVVAAVIFLTDFISHLFRCRDSSVVTATCYGLYGSGIESRWRRDFPHLSRPALGPTQPRVQCVTGLPPGRKTAGVCRWPTTPVYHRG
jgi:hypothetical protein